MVLVQPPGVWAGPVFRIEVFATGHVRWVGYALTTELGEVRAAIEPALARRWLDLWHQTDLEAVPLSPSEAVCCTDVVPTQLVHVDAADNITVRWTVTVLQIEGEPPRLPELIERRGFSQEDVARLDTIERELREVANTADWVLGPWCGDYLWMDVRYGVDDAVGYAARKLQRSPELAVQIAGVEGRGLRAQLAELQGRLLAEGVPPGKIRVQSVPAFGDPVSTALAGSAWVWAAPPHCFGAPRNTIDLSRRQGTDAGHTQPAGGGGS